MFLLIGKEWFQVPTQAMKLQPRSGNAGESANDPVPKTPPGMNAARFVELPEAALQRCSGEA
jgi:hypothetical protein